MAIWTAIHSSLTSIGVTKLRSCLTVMGVVIGVSAIIVLMALGRGAQKQITTRIEALGTDLLFVQPGAVKEGFIQGELGSSDTLTLSDAFALVDPLFAPSVAAVAPEIRFSGRIVAGRKNTIARIGGVTPAYQAIRNSPVKFGRFISSTDVINRTQVVVLGSRVSESLFGSRVPVGQPVRIIGRQYYVIGVSQSQGGNSSGVLDDQILIPITTMHYRLYSRRTPQGSISIHYLNVQAKDSQSIESASKQISTILRRRHRLDNQDDFTITVQQDIIDTLKESSNTFVWFLGAIASISLLVGGIGIMNIMLVSVSERTREIGVRRAMGAKKRDILMQFLLEAVLLSLGGGVIGAMSGLALAQLLDQRRIGEHILVAITDADIFLLALIVSVGVGLFFGIYPAQRAASMHPIDALRYE